MKTTVTQENFMHAFHAYGRYEQFGYDALCSLFDYFKEVEQDTGEEIELDVISICCDYSVDTVEGIAGAYSIDIEGLDEDAARQAVVDYLETHSTVIDANCGPDGKIVYCSSF